MNKKLNYAEKTFDYEGHWLDISYEWKMFRKNSLCQWEIELFEIVWASETGSEFPVNLIFSMDDFEYESLAKAFENDLRKEACND